MHETASRVAYTRSQERPDMVRLPFGDATGTDATLPKSSPFSVLRKTIRWPAGSFQPAEAVAVGVGLGVTPPSPPAHALTPATTAAAIPAATNVRARRRAAAVLIPRFLRFVPAHPVPVIETCKSAHDYAVAPHSGRMGRSGSADERRRQLKIAHSERSSLARFPLITRYHELSSRCRYSARMVVYFHSPATSDQWINEMSWPCRRYGTATKSS
jgi:hypothetical protein